MTKHFSFTLPIAALLAAVGGGMLVAFRLRPVQVKGGVAKVQIALGQLGTSNRLAAPAQNLVAGDSVERAFDLSNTGAGRVSVLALTTTAASSSVLDTDTRNGLQLRIDRCSRAWTESGPPYRYSCPGRPGVVVATRPIIGTNIPLLRLRDVRRPGMTAHLRLTLTLPASAPHALEGRTSKIQYEFVGA
jgi:hypothetical protein